MCVYFLTSLALVDRACPRSLIDLGLSLQGTINKFLPRHCDLASRRKVVGGWYS